MRRAIWALLFVVAAAAGDPLPESRRYGPVARRQAALRGVQRQRRSAGHRYGDPRLSWAGRPWGKVPRGIALAPDGKRLYVTNSWSDTVSEVDTASFQSAANSAGGLRAYWYRDGCGAKRALRGEPAVRRYLDDRSGPRRRRAAVRGGPGSQLRDRVARRRAHLCQPHLPEHRPLPRAPMSEITEMDAGHQTVARSFAPEERGRHLPYCAFARRPHRPGSRIEAQEPGAAGTRGARLGVRQLAGRFRRRHRGRSADAPG